MSLESILCLANCKITKSAAEETIRDREELQLGVFNGNEETGVKEKNQILRLSPNPHVLLQMEMKILQMRSLETLVVGQFEESVNENGIRVRRTQLRFLLVNLLVTKCAPTLKKLILYEHYLVPDVDYPKLLHLKCGRLSSNIVTAAPKLLHVECTEISLETIRRLPTTLETYYDAGIWNDSRSIAQALCHLVNLKNIRLRIGGESRGIEKLLSPFSKLESLHLILDFNDDELMDHLFDAIASDNLMITKLRIGKVRLSDDSLLLLSRLKKLQHIELSCSGSGFSGPAIASYLSTTSPDKLKHFIVKAESMFPEFNAKIMNELVHKLKDDSGKKFACSFIRIVPK